MSPSTLSTLLLLWLLLSREEVYTRAQHQSPRAISAAEIIVGVMTQEELTTVSSFGIPAEAATQESCPS